MQGKGRLTLASGSVFQGEFADNKLALSPSFANPEAAGTIEGRLIGFCNFSSE